MDGVVSLLKPPGMTSSNAVYDVRRVFHEKRAGHLGTLDPGASGVLPVCIGRATRLFDYLVEKEKEYVFEIAFGAATDTQDAFGRVTARNPRVVTRSELCAALPGFLGTQAQTASIYSALKVDGKKMCDLARAGRAVEPKTREITVHALELLDETAENRFLLCVRCSRGTYVRTLCADIGGRLGTVAHMAFLLRTATGPFSIGSSYTVAELEAKKLDGTLADAVISCEAALAFLPALTLPDDRRTPARNGLETAVRNQLDGNVRLYCGDAFLGIGRVEAGSVKLAVHLYETTDDAAASETAREGSF